MRTHLQRLYVNTGQLSEQLQDCECPPGCELLWEAFNALGRAPGASGLTPLTQAEIQAWQANYGVQLTSWEIDSLIAIDHVAAAARSTHQNNQNQ